MEALPLTIEEIVSHLANAQEKTRRIPKNGLADLEDPRQCVGPEKLRPFFGPKGIHFFKIRYDDGEIIMPAGVFSEFAGVHLQGKVQVIKGKPSLSSLERKRAECWNRPGWLFHRLEQWVLDRTDRRETNGEEKQGTRRARFGQWVKTRLRRWPIGSMYSRLSSLNRRHYEQALANPLAIKSDSRPPQVEEIAVLTTHENGTERDVFDRFTGVSSALWNLPRSVTLVAQPDEEGRPCEFLLVKRDVLEVIRENSPFFHQIRAEKFLDTQLPLILCENRLFRHLFYQSDFANWPRFLDLLGRTEKPPSNAVARIQELLNPELVAWLDTDSARNPAEGSVRYRVLSGINELLKRRDLLISNTWPADARKRVDRFLNGRAVADLTANEVIQLDHLLVESAFGPEIITPSEVCPPLQREDFERLLKLLRNNPAGGISLKQYAAEQAIFEQGKPADSLHVIVGGKVRVTQDKQGGSILINQLEKHGFFGVSWIEPDNVHTATITAQSEVHTAEFTGAALDKLKGDPFLLKKLKGEYHRIRLRDQLLENIDRQPPAHPSEAIAAKLLAGSNLLRIDMDLCTRCDQCVAACSEAHEGVTRFHRANPKLRFGKWEIARACVHCSDAPCQTACPVGAITFLNDGIVQLHRSRCIGCNSCPPACPFDAIEMIPPRFKEFQVGGQAIIDMAPNNNPGLVASKCDLCLTVNRDPPCVVSCPYGAAQRGAPRELFPSIKSWADVLTVS